VTLAHADDGARLQRGRLLNPDECARAIAHVLHQKLIPDSAKPYAEMASADGFIIFENYVVCNIFIIFIFSTSFAHFNLVEIAAALAAVDDQGRHRP
jgi:hypothetical protein